MLYCMAGYCTGDAKRASIDQETMRRILKNKGARTGVFFGATSGVITTIGLIAGLNAGTNSLVAVLGGILVVAVADAMSDAMGIHLAQEADPDSTPGKSWPSGLWTVTRRSMQVGSTSTG